MTAIKVKAGSFAGAKNLYGPSGLAAAIQGLAIDAARSRIVAETAVVDFTDNSTGTAGSALAALVIPTAAFDATSAGGASRANFNTAVGKIENAEKVMSNSINRARAALGLVALTMAAGAEAVADTIPAQDATTGAAVAGSLAMDFASGRAAMKQIVANLRTLVAGYNEVAVALGKTQITDPNRGAYSQTAMVDIATVDVSVTGASAISNIVADAFLLAHANSLAHIAAAWNAVVGSTLDDSGLSVVAAV